MYTQQSEKRRTVPSKSLTYTTTVRETSNKNDNSRIKVVVRIRPLNSKELMRNQRIIVGGNNESVTLWDPSCLDLSTSRELKNIDASAWSKVFTFDRILWSLDTNNYASQNTVFIELGLPIIEWVLKGYNCSVLAYGQTGTGKTYTMTGNMRNDPNEYGLIPRICFGLFEALESNYSDSHEATVTFSHMEIYNENVRDLLSPESSAASSKGYLRVREHPSQGVFVSNLTTVKVDNFDDVMSLISIGDKNRTVANTNSNAHSSRSHAIVSLTVIQRTLNNMNANGIPTSGLEQKVSRVHLVDLAGSERVAHSGAKGDRLKEANHINVSLSVLGDVIKSLGDLKGQKGHIPYRNSTLTHVLKESLGGNAHALMVSTISPSSQDYEETLSTLKYAERAKRVRMHVEANITSGLMATDTSAVDLVPLLQAEVRKLREMLRLQQLQQKVSYDALGDPYELSNPHAMAMEIESRKSSETLAGLDKSGTRNNDMLQEMASRVRELEEQLAERERLISSLVDKNSNNDDSSAVVVGADGVSSTLKTRYMNNDSSSPSSVARNNFLAVNGQTVRGHPLVMLAEDAVDVTSPRLINLNQDPLFSECLVYYLPDGAILVGGQESKSDVVLSGPDILEMHCEVRQKKGVVTLTPLPGALVFVNGDVIENNDRGQPCTVTVEHYDRVAFGRFHLFRFEFQKDESNMNSDMSKPGWEFAQEELLSKNNAIMSLKKLSNGPMEPLQFFRSNTILLRNASQADNIVTIQDYNQSPMKKYDKNDTIRTHLRPKQHFTSPNKDNVSLFDKRRYNHPQGNDSVPNKHRSISDVSDFNDNDVVVHDDSIELPPPPLIDDISIYRPQITGRKDGDMNSSVRIDQMSSTARKDDWLERLNRIAVGSETVSSSDMESLMNDVARGSLNYNPQKNTTDQRSVDSDQIEAKGMNVPRFGKMDRIDNKESNRFDSYIGQRNQVDSIRTTTNASPVTSPRSRLHKSSMNSSSLSHDVFEREAKALQEELAVMQKTLEDRMLKYQSLTSYSR